MIQVLIADDHAIVRKGMKEIVSETEDIVITGEASDGHQALSKILNENYDVVILDISMPGRSGIDVLDQIKKGKPGLPVLMLSMYPEEQYAVRALKLGAAGYLTKKSVPDELIDAVRKVYHGGKYISPILAEKLADYIYDADDEKPPHENLTDKEFQIMRMIAEGNRIKDIAAK
ncbi:MAG: response regulator transcription factor, partial [Deltaproteobacteria bacterium]|nr:response regulator transcription factor [Deltaproteobacteria bacterium]